MVIANTTCGLTRTFDLTNPIDLSSMRALLASRDVTALSLLIDGTRHTLPAPRGFRGAGFGAEPIVTRDKEVVGERIYAQAGDVRLAVSWAFGSKLVRSDLTRTGMMRYQPRH